MNDPVPDGRAQRAARQFIETSRLLGVDFVPAPRHHDPCDDDTEVPAVMLDQPAPAPRKASATSDPEVVTRAAAPARRPLSAKKKAEALAALRERHDRECPHCTQAQGWTHLVFGDGDPDARLMFVGEAPGAEEDRQGIPFVGRSGQKLNEMIKAMGLSREEVYIANVLKSRPPNNATPTTTEADRCGIYLREQVAIIQPDVIVTLGKPAAQLLLHTREAMGALRGTWQEYEGIPVMPTFHPAYLLRQYTPENRRLVWSDLQKAMTRLKT